MKTDPKTHSDVLNAFDHLWQAYMDKDLKAVLSCYSDDEDAVIFGSGPGETIYGAGQIRACFERDFAQWDSMRLEFDAPRVSGADNVAWLTSEGHAGMTIAGRPTEFDTRFSAVLEKRDGRWVFVQTHFAIPCDVPQGSLA